MDTAVACANTARHPSQLLKRPNTDHLHHTSDEKPAEVFVVFVVLLLIQIQPFFEPENLIGGSLFARVLVPFLPFAAEFLRTGRLGV